MADYSKALGDSVYRKRKQLHWTQAELAEKIGVTEQTVRKIEHYHANPQMDVLYSLIRILQIDPADIFYPEVEAAGAAKRQLKNLLSEIGNSEAEDLLPITQAVLSLLKKVSSKK